MRVNTRTLRKLQHELNLTLSQQQESVQMTRIAYTPVWKFCLEDSGDQFVVIIGISRMQM